MAEAHLTFISFVSCVPPERRMRDDCAVSELDGVRKQLVAVMLEGLVIHPAIRGRNMFDPSKVEPVWRV